MTVRESFDLYTSLIPSREVCDYDLHLVTLQKDVAETIKNGQGSLYIKASSQNEGYPVITTNSKTFKIRQQNQSNCVMLMEGDPVNNKSTAISFHNFHSQLILEDVKPEIPVNNLHTITRIDEFDKIKPEIDGYTMNNLYEDSKASPKEFKELVPYHQIIEFKGNCYLIDNRVITKCIDQILQILINSIVKSGKELEIMESLEKLKVSTVRDIINNSELVNKIPLELTNLCIEKFFNKGQLNDNLIIKQFGLEVLKKYKDLKLDDFMINLKLQLPFNYTPEINLRKALKGFYFTYDNDKMISYLDETMLSEQPLRRFQQLFALKSSWDVDDIEPFVNRINQKGIKVDKYLLKYCRVRRNGKRHIATSR